MALPHHKALTTIEGLHKTVINDKFVYRWLLHLYSQPEMAGRIQKMESVAGPYGQLGKITARLWLYNTGLFISMILLFLSKSLLFILPAAISLVLFVREYNKKKKCVADIGVAVISEDFPPDKIMKTTLFQLGEFYSEKYRILSLVDAIYHLDKIGRVTLLITFILVCYVILFDAWIVRYLMLLVFYSAVGILSNSALIYSRFK